MESRKGWGGVVWATVFAVLVIATAAGTYFFENNGGLPFLTAREATNPNDADNDGLTLWEERVWKTDPALFDTDGDGAGDGAEVSAGSNPLMPGHSTNAYEAGAGGVSPSTQLAENVVAAYGIGFQTEAERSAAVTDIAKTVTLPDLTEKLIAADLNISNKVSLKLYAAILYEILRESVSLTEYELSSFRRIVTESNYYGSPELQKAATAYKEIQAALVAMQIPPSVANEHLQLVNDVGTLANTVSAMAAWGGDPLAGMAYAGVFLEAEARVEESMTVLFQKVATLLKTQ